MPAGTRLGRSASGSAKSEATPSAGVLLVWKQHLQVESLSEDLRKQFYLDDDFRSRVVAVFLRLKGLTVLLVEVYLWTGEGMSDRNRDMLNHITTFSQALGCQLLLLGDFQASAADVRNDP